MYLDFRLSLYEKASSWTFMIRSFFGKKTKTKPKKRCFPNMGFQEDLNLQISASSIFLKCGETKWLPHQLFFWGRDEFQLYQNHSDIYGKNTCISDTCFPSVAFVQQLVLGSLTKRNINFIYIQEMSFLGITVTQRTFFRNAGGKTISNVYHKIIGFCILLFPPLMMT